MLAAIELFKEDGTVDELGIGAVRDTIASALFPGVSVLHTRARYLLFVPWCILQVAERGLQSGDAMRELRRVEISLLHALLAGEDEDGLIGRVARDKLKRLPSAAYWSVLQRWGIRTVDSSIAGYFRDARLVQQQQRRTPASDDRGIGAVQSKFGFDASIPPPPPDLHRLTDFRLTPDESAFLAYQWRTTAKGSLLPWVLDAGAEGVVANIWAHPQLASAPDDLRSVVEHGRRFSNLSHGAALLYNLMLAETFDEQDDRHLVDHYRERLSDWHNEVRSDAEVWEREAFWIMVRRRNPGLKRATEVFVESWIELVQEPGAIAESHAARDLVRTRERVLKGGRARLFNDSARNQWAGASGLVRIDYNWAVTRRLAADILGKEEIR